MCALVLYVCALICVYAHVDAYIISFENFDILRQFVFFKWD